MSSIDTREDIIEIQRREQVEEQRRMDFKFAREEASTHLDPSSPHQMTNVDQVRTFVLAGNARFTLRSKATGTRFTFKVRQPAENKPHFVSLLNGSSNEEDYKFLGTIFPDGYRPGRRSSITPDAPSAKAFTWFWKKLGEGKLSDQLEVWHEGRCCRCGRTLTVPESIASGIGPECAKKMHS
jgi:hypothetical protein